MTRVTACRGWLGRLAALAVLTLLGGCAGAAPTLEQQPAVTSAGELRVFWVNSRDAGDRWALQMRTGVVETMARAGYGLAERTLSWDARHLAASPASSAEDVADRVAESVTAIREFSPDVVIVSDDEAAQWIVSQFAPGGLRFVVCGLSGSTESAGLLREDVVVIREEMRPVQTVAMARELTGGSGPYLLIGDHSISGLAATSDALETLNAEADGSELLSGTADSWEAWKALVLEHMGNVDFILISSYQPLPDTMGQPVASRAMMAWMLDIVPVPVFAMSNAVVVDGAVGGLVPDAYEQGRLAGLAAMDVMREAGDVVQPGPSAHSRLVLNAAGARHWGLAIPALFPIAAEVHSSLPVLQGGQ